MITNDGGPAFPHGPLGDSMHFEDGIVTHQYPAGLGMSLRDWFAAMAMQGDWASQSAETGEFINIMSAEDLNERCALYYRASDAMLKAREMKQ